MKRKVDEKVCWQSAVSSQKSETPCLSVAPRVGKPDSTGSRRSVSVCGKGKMRERKNDEAMKRKKQVCDNSFFPFSPWFSKCQTKDRNSLKSK
jgi:hypothetical protein